MHPKTESVRLAGLSDPERFTAIAVQRATGTTATDFDADRRWGVYDFNLTYDEGRTGVPPRLFAANEQSSGAAYGVEQ